MFFQATISNTQPEKKKKTIDEAIHCPHPNPGHRSGFPPATVKLVATDLVIFLEVPEFLGFSGTTQVEPIH